MSVSSSMGCMSRFFHGFYGGFLISLGFLALRLFLEGSSYS